VFIEAKDDGGGSGNWTTGAISRAKLQSNHHHQQTGADLRQKASSATLPERPPLPCLLLPPLPSHPLP